MPTLLYRQPPPARPKPGPSVMTVKPHFPWLCPILIGLVLIVIGGGGLLLCQSSLQALGKSKQVITEQYVQRQEQDIQQYQNIQQQNASLTVQNKELRNKLANLVHTTQQGQQTYTEVLQALTQLQTEYHDIKEERDFYVTLLASTSLPSVAKVMVKDFTISYDNNNYLYQLVLIQPAKDAKMTTGHLQIHVLGQRHNDLEIKSITVDAINPLEYNMTYFKKFKGYLQLPTDLIPQQVIVRILSTNQKQANEISFPWTDLLTKEQL